MIKQDRHGDIVTERRITFSYWIFAGVIAYVYIEFRVELELFIKYWCAL